MVKNNSELKINPAYLNPQLVPQMQEAFNSHPSIPNIKLGQILDSSSYKNLKSIVIKTKTKLQVDPLEYRFHVADISMPQLTSALSQFLSQSFNITLKSNKWKLVRMTWKEYSMILDIQKLRNGHDVIVDVTDDFPQNAGGDIVYTIGGKETVEIPASSNTLVVVKITKNTRSFLKYANHYAKVKNRYFLIQQL